MPLLVAIVLHRPSVHLLGSTIMVEELHKSTGIPTTEVIQVALHYDAIKPYPEEGVPQDIEAGEVEVGADLVLLAVTVTEVETSAGAQYRVLAQEIRGQP